MPHDHRARARRLSQGHAAQHVPQAVDAALDAHAGMVALVVRRSRGGASQGRRAADDDLARHASTPRRCSGSRRRCFRPRSTRRARSSTSGASTSHFAQELLDEQPISDHTMWNQLEYRGARGVRLRGHAVQLHVDRRQPADRAGADGQHRRLEAGVERDVLGALPDAAATRRPACRPA